MQAFVSYVIQDEKGHRHLSEVVSFDSPPYTFSADPPVQQIFQWAEKKQAGLPKGEKLIVLNILKV